MEQIRRTQTLQHLTLELQRHYHSQYQLVVEIPTYWQMQVQGHGRLK